RHREHRLEPFLVDARDPFEAGVSTDVGDRQVRAVLRDPAGDALANPQVRLADHLRVEPVGRGQLKLPSGRVQQVERADVDRHRRGRLADDQLDQLARLLGGRRLLGEPLQEVELPYGVMKVLRLDGPHTRYRTVAEAKLARAVLIKNAAWVRAQQTRA